MTYAPWMPLGHRPARGLRTRLLWTALDAGVWAASLAVALWLRLDYEITELYAAPLAAGAVCVIVVHVSVGWLFGPYAVGHELGSFEETAEVARAASVAGFTLAVLTLLLSLVELPRTVPLIALALAVMGMFAARFLIRSRRTHQAVRGDSTKRAIIFGAGSGARILMQSLVRDPASGIVPVALLDDDRGKARLHFSGVRVRGTRDDIACIAAKYAATTLVIAVPSATSETVRELSALARESGLDVLVLPPVRELLGGRPTASDLRNLDVADLLGRQPVHLDMAAIADHIGGKRVLVTGAGGSIGSELCRQITKFGPSRLLMLDRDESGLHATQLSIEGRSTLDSDDILLCDIRDVEALEAAFVSSRPQIVFHAAALKHLTMLEHHPSEAFKTNVVGTRNVLEAARSVGVETFVNISTDKAARPTCVLGWSKRVAERLTASFNGAGQRPLHQRALRQRAGVAGLGGSGVPRADQPRWAGHRHPPRRRALLHAHPRGLPARAPGRRHGSRRRGDGARHGLAREDRRGGPYPDRPVRPHRYRDRLHRPAPRREAHRRALHPRRGDRALRAPTHLAGVRAGPRAAARRTARGPLRDVEIREWMHRRGGVALSSVAS